jgi:hypothetical protein
MNPHHDTDPRSMVSMTCSLRGCRLHSSCTSSRRSLAPVTMHMVVCIYVSTKKGACDNKLKASLAMDGQMGYLRIHVYRTHDFPT